MTATISEARRRLNLAQAELDAAVMDRYPVGSAIIWHWGNVYCRGVVVLHGYGDRIKVRNEETGKERWLSSFNLV